MHEMRAASSLVCGVVLLEVQYSGGWRREVGCCQQLYHVVFLRWLPFASQLVTNAALLMLPACSTL